MKVHVKCPASEFCFLCRPESKPPQKNNNAGPCLWFDKTLRVCMHDSLWSQAFSLTAQTRSVSAATDCWKRHSFFHCRKFLCFIVSSCEEGCGLNDSISCLMSFLVIIGTLADYNSKNFSFKFVKETSYLKFFLCFYQSPETNVVITFWSGPLSSICLPIHHFPINLILHNTRTSCSPKSLQNNCTANRFSCNPIKLHSVNDTPLPNVKLNFPVEWLALLLRIWIVM